MMRGYVTAFVMCLICLGACKVPVKSQIPTHQAEFMMPTSDYPKLLDAFDRTAASFGLQRVGAAPGLKELHDRQVMFAAYEARGQSGWRGVLDVTDVKGQGKVLIWVYEDGIADTQRRSLFVAEVTDIVHRFGGKLLPKEQYK